MKKIVLIALVLLFSLSAFARPVKRITFPKGATKVTVAGYLNGYKDSQTYLIRLRKGQKMTLDANRYVSLFITNPNGEDASDMDLSCHSHQVVENTTAGDYKIKAVECMKADAWKGSFKLTVKVEEMPAPLPSDEELNQMVQTTTQDFTDAVEAADFTEFRETISTVFKEQFTVKQFNTTFQPFIKIKDKAVPILRSTKETMPLFLADPKTVVEKGYDVLVIDGSYPTVQVVKFYFRYLKEGNQ